MCRQMWSSVSAIDSNMQECVIKWETEQPIVSRRNGTALIEPFQSSTNRTTVRKTFITLANLPIHTYSHHLIVRRGIIVTPRREVSVLRLACIHILQLKVIFAVTANSGWQLVAGTNSPIGLNGAQRLPACAWMAAIRSNSVVAFGFLFFFIIWHYYIFAVSQKSICVEDMASHPASATDPFRSSRPISFVCNETRIPNWTTYFPFHFWMAAAQQHQRWPSRTNNMDFFSLLRERSMHHVYKWDRWIRMIRFWRDVCWSRRTIVGSMQFHLNDSGVCVRAVKDLWLAELKECSAHEPNTCGTYSDTLRDYWLRCSDRNTVTTE